MATNTDETVFNGALADQVKELAKEAKAKKRIRMPEKRWQRVAIGGVSGIVFGAGGAFAASKIQEIAPGEGEGEDVLTMENGLKVAEVDDSQSFQEAFDSARSRVGAGGAFHWHGNTYSTYKTSEWDDMSSEEHDAFAHQVTEVKDVEFTHHAAQPEEGVAIAADGYTDPSDLVAHNVDESSDVQIVGSSEVELADGSVVTVGEAVVNDHDVYLVDLDNDSVYDHAIDDVNGDGVIADAESYGIQDDNLVADAGITEADNLIL